MAGFLAGVEAKERVSALISLGGASGDRSALTSQRFEAAVATGRIRIEGLFDTTCPPIAQTGPRQVVTRFATLTDRLLPESQEAASSLTPRIVY